MDNMLLKLFCFYRKRLKCLRELKVFGEIYDQAVAKPYKSYGISWIAHKLNAMEIVLNNYGIFIKHLDSLAHTNSTPYDTLQSLGRTRYPIHFAAYLDVLTSLSYGRIEITFG